jgi:hypothetical protein
MTAGRLILILSAVVGVAIGLEKVGAFKLSPETDIAFRWSPVTLADGRSAIRFTNDAGSLSCWLRLSVSSPGVRPEEARLSAGDALALTVERWEPDRAELTVSKAPNPPAGGQFIWPAGVPIDVVWPSPSVAAAGLTDWTVHLTDKPSDSWAKARQRFWWTRISWCLLAIALIGAGVGALKESSEHQERVTPRGLVRTIVEGIEGPSRKETRQLRAVLTKVLLGGATVTEAMDALRVPATRSVRFQLLIRARTAFVGRLKRIQTELDGYAALL